MHDSAPGSSAEVGSEAVAYTVPEAAKRLRLSERYVWNLVRDGVIRSKKIGRSRRIPHAALVAYLDEQAA